MTDHRGVVTLANLDDAPLSPLLEETALALHVPGFTPAAEAEHIARRLAEHQSLSTYRNTTELVRIGQSHFETHDEEGNTDLRALEEYLARAEQLMAEIRQCCTPYEPPLDLLWQALDRSYGIERPRIGAKHMFAGICRVFPEGSELLPHNDSLERDAPGLPLGRELDAQLAANIYLRVPERGGELQIWDLRPTQKELDALQAPGSHYGADRALLPPPACQINPGPGDLVILDATRLHAVARQERGDRISLSCFLGARSGRPLVCWS